LPKLSALIVASATLAYPFAIYFAFGRVEPFWLALGLVALSLVRAWASRDRLWLVAAGACTILALASLLGGGWQPVKLYPVFVNGALLAVFGYSVMRPPTVIERIARMAEPVLAPQAVTYTRKVTLAWCLFFVCNGALALATALWASNEVWLFYNGFLAYVLMGALFAGEWLVRRRVRARVVARQGAAHV
jgi:uncharacterized membrane protein